MAEIEEYREYTQKRKQQNREEEGEGEEDQQWEMGGGNKTRHIILSRDVEVSGTLRGFSLFINQLNLLKHPHYCLPYLPTLPLWSGVC